MLVHSVSQAVQVVKDQKINFPVLIISVPAANCERGLIAQDSTQFPLMVELLLKKSSYCPRQTVHIVPKGEKSDDPYWKDVTIAYGPF